MTTLLRWSDLWQRLGSRSSSESIFEELGRAYQQPQRAYHTLDHIHNCLTQFDLVHHLAQFPDEVEFALWCHDVIYDPHAADNEVHSAAWAARVLRKAAVANEVIARVAALILATQHHTLPDDPDVALVVDIDLSILGQPVVEFDRYEAAIRREYEWVPETAYRQARLRILNGFAARPAIYQTAFFQEHYEAQARLNLARSIHRLQEG
jgi:predicted metal-dependent HD superfamily phosphohydrolase